MLEREEKQEDSPPLGQPEPRPVNSYTIFSDMKDRTDHMDSFKLTNRFNTIQMRLNANNFALCGDIFAQAEDQQEKTVGCLEKLLECIEGHQDFKIEVQKEIRDLKLLNRSLEKKLASMKNTNSDELVTLQGKNKSLADQLQEKKKGLLSQRVEFESTIASLENKLKQVSTEVRKKENMVNQLSEKAYNQTVKQPRTFEISGHIHKPIMLAENESSLADLYLSEATRLRSEVASMYDLMREVVQAAAKVIQADHDIPLPDKIVQFAGMTCEDFKRLGMPLLKDSMEELVLALGKKPKLKASGFSSQRDTLGVEEIIEIKRLHEIIRTVRSPSPVQTPRRAAEQADLAERPE